MLSGLRTLQMLLLQVPEKLIISGKNVICKVDNQVVKAVWERKGTSHFLALNSIRKDIYWLQYWGEFFLSLEYVRSELNVSDEFTRQSPGLEASLSQYSLHQDKVYCFPPLPIVGTVLEYLEQQKMDCVLVLPATNEPWVNLVSAYIIDLEVISKPFCTKAFTVLNNSGKRIPKKYPFSMLAVKLSFKENSSLLKHLL